ncbi:MAG: DUF3142 domain-containing protein [Phycisphaeraceae bacterium]|nr:DUF3142 domain-containing protein [Phycisphaeraceae bacterium]MCW5753697.1 DUF3142 domain-containing protein [Phycisphaeraceae bacterium]
MRPRKAVLITLIAAFAASVCWTMLRSGGVSVGGPMAHGAYIWQRVWSGPVQDAASLGSREFAALYVLGAEWEAARSPGDSVGRPAARGAGGSGAPARGWAVAEVVPTWEALGQGSARVVLVYRLVASGPGAPLDADLADRIVEMYRRQADAAAAAGVVVHELQVDYDAPTRGMTEYAQFLRGLRAKLGETSLTITALPTWLEAGAFGRVADCVDAYVLQVHSLQRPGAAATSLCDPVRAERWVRAAGRLGRPFYVALPTYGYLLGVDARGKVVEIGAEQARQRKGALEAGGHALTLMPDAAAMGRLVASWTRHRPACMLGVVWFRLPTSQDVLAWHPATLRAVMAGHSPASRVRYGTHTDATGLTWVVAMNHGDADGRIEPFVTVQVHGGRVVVADALSGFAVVRSSPDVLTFRPMHMDQMQKIVPGEERRLGWVRAEPSGEVVVHVND